LYLLLQSYFEERSKHCMKLQLFRDKGLSQESFKENFILMRKHFLTALEKRRI
jgi:hypothetical protein